MVREMVNAILVLSVNKLTDDPINDNEKTRKSFLSTSSIHSMVGKNPPEVPSGQFERALAQIVYPLAFIVI